jgi:hypothetical protein
MLDDRPGAAIMAAYLPSGVRIADDAQLTSEGRVLVALHRADPELYRMNPQPAIPGPVIEDLTDGEHAVAVSATLPNGRVRVTHATSWEHARSLLGGHVLASSGQPSAGVSTITPQRCVEGDPNCTGPVEPCAASVSGHGLTAGAPIADVAPMCGGGGGGVMIGPPPSGELRVYRFATFGYCDHGAICGNPEFRFKSWGPSGEQRSALIAVHIYDDRTIDTFLRNERPIGETTFRVEIWEEDSWGDDMEGRIDLREADFTNRYNNGLLMSRTYVGNSSRCGSDQCTINPTVHPELLINFRVVP